MNYPQRIKNWLLDLVFPVRCVNCGKFGEYLCSGCLNQVPVRENFECIGCKQPAPLGQTCRFCQPENPADNLFVVSDYKSGLVQKIIKTFKFRFVAELSNPLSRLAEKYIRRLQKRKGFNIFGGNPLLMPVQMHQRRENWRGFNQSALLAKSLAEKFQMEYAAGALVKIKNKTPQTDIKERAERLANQKGAFFCAEPEKVSGRAVLLIDDVCTTGATLNECAKVLKENGVKNVMVLVIARG